ncbi:MAG: Mur ligase family protein [Candidatus Pacebacteria bacterium]|nr:Mur ligase family protein [Candidatus Paceibacterota bacterium]
MKKIIIKILTLESRLVIWRHKPRIVAVTGTVGKTSTKDAIYTVFSNFFDTRKSKKSFNSEIGVPLTILDLSNKWNSFSGWAINIVKGFFVIFSRNYPKWLILEVGMDRPGEIKRIAKWLKPDMVVATHFADIPVHVEFFNSPRELIEEEQSIAYSLKEDGVLVINGGDKYGLELKSKLDVKTVSFGMEETAGVVASHLETLYEGGKPIGIRFRAEHEGSSGPIVLKGVLGVQHVFPVLAALSCGIALDLNVVAMSEAFRGHTPPPGRMRILDGINNSIIIDDTYNSSPIAVEKALDVVKDLQTSGRKVVILGDMRELGDYAIKEHERIGLMASRVSDMLLFVGRHAKDFQREINDSNSVVDVEGAISFMKNKVKDGDVILVKGSQGIRLEKLVAILMKYPERKKNLLVRQDKEWKSI